MEPLKTGDPRYIGRYELLGLLGSGGMGRVYLGRSPGRRLVAVKVVRSEYADDAQFRARFAREVSAVRAVGGFWTASVVDADAQAVHPWLATEYVPGPSLEQAVIGSGPLPEETVGVLAAGLAEALTAIHAAGLVHRDLKPSNVLLASDGPRVIDFGISRALEGAVLTSTGKVFGTPGFLAPEQALGSKLGPAADVFSLGAVLAFAATGRGPFGEGSVPTLLFRVVHAEPDLTGTSDSLRRLIGWCLAKEAAARPTPAQLVQELGGVAEATRALSPGWLPATVTGLIDSYAVDVGTTGPLSSSLSSSDVREPASGPAPGLPQVAGPHGSSGARPAGPQSGPPGGDRRRRPWAAALGAGILAAGTATGVSLLLDQGTAPSDGVTGSTRGPVETGGPSVPGLPPQTDARRARVIGSIPVQKDPATLAVSPDGRHAYVTSLTGNVSVIDTAVGAATATIPVGGFPVGVAVTPDGRRAYVASGTAVVIDTATDTAATAIPIRGGAWGMAVAPNGRHAYVAHRGAGTVSVIDTATSTVTATIKAAANPADSPVEVAVAPDGRHVYATNRGSGTVSVIDTTTNTVTATVPVQSGPNGVAVAPDGRRAYVTNEGADTVSVIDTATDTVTAAVPVGDAPITVAVTRDGQWAYVVDRGSKRLSVIDTAATAVAHTIPLGGDPGAVAVSPDGRRVYVTNGEFDAVSVIEVPAAP